jgi:hypothetical protein
MHTVQLPLWIVTENKNPLNPPRSIPCDDSTAALAFTTTTALVAFLSARMGGRWDVYLVADREGVVLAVSNLHAQGIANICIDAEPDGSGGELIGIGRLFALLESDQQV